MSEKDIFAGMPFEPSVRQCVEKSYPGGTISFTHGPLDQLEEKELYLVRLGQNSVIMPRMKYSDSVKEELEK